jgi:hypothetical protein
MAWLSGLGAGTALQSGWRLLMCPRKARASQCHLAAWVAHWRIRQGSSVDSYGWILRRLPWRKLRDKASSGDGALFQMYSCWGLFQLGTSVWFAVRLPTITGKHCHFLYFFTSNSKSRLQFTAM